MRTILKKVVLYQNPVGGEVKRFVEIEVLGPSDIKEQDRRFPDPDAKETIVMLTMEDADGDEVNQVSVTLSSLRKALEDADI